MRLQVSMEILVGGVIVLFFALYASATAVGINSSAHSSSGILSAYQNASLLAANALLNSCGCLVKI